jgi:hypothetical protein
MQYDTTFKKFTLSFAKTESQRKMQKMQLLATPENAKKGGVQKMQIAFPPPL